MTFTCMICGKEFEQPYGAPAKLFCSDRCMNRQYYHHFIPPAVVAAEKDRRRHLLGSAQKSAEERRAYNRRKRQEYIQREAKIYAGCDEPKPTRKCHNPLCRNLTWDYYCPECHRKQRRRAGLDMDREETESVWDGF